MRIGLFTDRYLPQTDGVSVATDTMRLQLEQLGHEVYVVAPKPSWRYREPSPHIIRLTAVKGLFGLEEHFTTFYFPPQMWRRMDDLHLDIIHFQTPGQVGFLGAEYAIRSHKPLVTTYHTDVVAYLKHYASKTMLPGVIALASAAPVMFGSKFEQYKESFASMKPDRDLVQWHKSIVTSMLRLANNHCDLVISPSEKIRRQLKDLGTTSRIAVLPSGVDAIPEIPGEAAQWREKLGLSAADKVVLFVGRVGAEKNVGLLINAFNMVADDHEDAKLLIVGPGDEAVLARFTAQAAASRHADRIIFAGRVERGRLGALYGLATVLGFPSLSDTQGLVVNEAVAAGLPVVMIDKQINSAVINDENGFVAGRSARDFAAKLSMVLDDPKLRARLAARSRELAKSFTAGKHARELVALYKETISRHDASRPVKAGRAK